MASTPGTLVTQAESLFESYLAARLVRARRALTTAKVALLRDPRNRPKLDALRAAELETQKLHEQLVEQRRKVARARDQSSAVSGETEPTTGFRQLQAAKAEAVYQSAGAPERRRQSLPDDRQCPKCGQRVAGDATACTCGYAFAASERNLPAEPFLTDEEMAALRGKLTKRPD